MANFSDLNAITPLPRLPVGRQPGTVDQPRPVYMQLEGEVAPVPDELVRHYLSLGAKIVGPPDAGAEAVEGLADPLNWVPTARAGEALAVTGKAGIQGLGRLLARPGARGAGRYLANELPVAKQITGTVKAAMEAERAALAGEEAAAHAASLPKVQFDPATGKVIPLRRADLYPESALRRAEQNAAGKAAAEARMAARRAPEPPEPAPAAKPRARSARPRRPAQGKTMSAAEQAAARAKGRSISPTSSPQAMRGASGPALARRAAYRERLMGQPEPEAPAMAQDMTAALEQSMLVEKELAARGFNPVERLAIRAMLRRQGVIP